MSKQIGTMSDFYEWVKARDPKETYDYYNCHTCANAMYHHDRGVEYVYDIDNMSDIERASMQNNLFPNQTGRAYMTMVGLRREIEEFWL